MPSDSSGARVPSGRSHQQPVIATIGAGVAPQDAATRSRARAWLSACSPGDSALPILFPNPDRRSPAGRAGSNAGAAPIRSHNTVCPHAENHVQVGLPEIAEENIGAWKQVVVAAAAFMMIPM